MAQEKISVTAVILTKNEEGNIESCLKSIHDWVENIIIVDSFSTDKTLDIARKYTNGIYQHAFENYARQFNWAIQNLTFSTKWLMRIDSDERITNELRDEIVIKLPHLSEDITGVFLKRRIYFMHKWIRFGGCYPLWMLRLWRKDKAYCENRWMDEHMKLLGGKFVYFKNDFIDENNNKLNWWTNKHNLYSNREAVDLLNREFSLFQRDDMKCSEYGQQVTEKRWFKENIYLRLPLFLRAFCYFIYRYIFRLGFLDGVTGLIWHFLQGFWYRFLVDAKIYEIKMSCGKDKSKIKAFIENNYNLKIDD